MTAITGKRWVTIERKKRNCIKHKDKQGHQLPDIETSP